MHEGFLAHWFTVVHLCPSVLVKHTKKERKRKNFMRSLKNGGVRRYWSPYLYIYMFYVLCLCTVDGGRHKKIESFSKLLKI